MTACKDILRRVGKVLIVVGLLDIALMVYCIVHGESYSSSLNIFAVIAGVFLWRGSPRAARLVTKYSAFGLAGIIGFCVVLLPFQWPIGLWAAKFALHPWGTTLFVIQLLALVGWLAWTYREMRTPSIVSALAATGEDARVPKGYFAIGAAIPLLLTVVSYVTLGGDTGAKAIALARARYGDAYRYNLTSISLSGGHTVATLDAYNSREIPIGDGGLVTRHEASFARFEQALLIAIHDRKGGAPIDSLRACPTRDDGRRFIELSGCLSARTFG